ncbi:MAG: N-acetylmuramoyl-L-alanine amidase [Prolixibacteraceae bacterium]|jgi:N-acetylmuramoyl-L-alanine amidase|nr:N-acetylmuramoyl-L-alanine amidase [Prolixibacteraceae bacterium]
MDKKPLLKIEKKFTKIIPAFVFVALFCLMSSLSVYAQEHKTHVAKSGDGIYSVLRDYGIPLSYINKFKKINEDVLAGGNELQIGKKYKLPLLEQKQALAETEKSSTASKITKRFPIFGLEHQDVEIVSNELSGTVYYLVSGHGGPDPGAVSKHNGKELCEDEYAYDITLRLARELLSMGAVVYMITRDNDDGIRGGWYLAPDKDEVCYTNLYIPLNQNARLRQRKDAVNKLYRKYKGRYQRALIIHVDSRSTREKIDVFFYYDQRSKAGKKTALTLRDTFDEKYNHHQPGRGYHGSVTSRNLYMLKYTYPVATYIEMGNINHQRDLKRFIIEGNRQAIAKWLAEGLKIDYESNR